MRIELKASMLAIGAVAGMSSFNCAFAQNAKTGNAKPKVMPYTTINHPEFVPASQATFLSSDYVLVGVASGGVVKAYPAADLDQHGVVQDQMPDGPIAVTW
jgi:hypothetical protein